MAEDGRATDERMDGSPPRSGNNNVGANGEKSNNDDIASILREELDAAFGSEPEASGQGLSAAEQAEYAQLQADNRNGDLVDDDALVLRRQWALPGAGLRKIQQRSQRTHWNKSGALFQKGWSTLASPK